MGVVIPVWNRRENLALLLASLERQTTAAFTVVVADDGSTDGTRDMVKALADTDVWSERLRLINCGPDQGVRTGRARNIGTANLPEDATLVVLLDSDLVVQPDALGRLAELHHRHPDAAIAGPVEWLPPLRRQIVLDAIVRNDLGNLRRRVPRATPRREEGTFVGPELRTGMFSGVVGEPVPLRSEWALSLNFAWPVDLYWRIGGFDEAMVGYGYEDNEFGARAAAHGVRCLARDELWALHVWHPKPPTAMAENQRNLDYYLRKHGPNDVIETDIDWRLWFHYHADRGGVAVHADDRLWALSADGHHRLALADRSWLRRLGHDSDPARLASAERGTLARATSHGVASEVPDKPQPLQKNRL
ncbi:MAG: glycosyltransferase family 2 protein [Micromonosporaceae bacterium]